LSIVLAQKYRYDGQKDVKNTKGGDKMELKQISPRIYYLPSTEETDRPVLGYIKGERFSLMVDAGNSPAHVALFNAALGEEGLPPPEFTAITHWHWDHTFGMCALSSRTIAGKLTQGKLRQISGWIWTEEAMAERLRTGEDIEFCDACVRLEYPDKSRIKVVTADLIFDRTVVLDLGGVHPHLMTITAPHSRDSVMVYVPEEKVLFIGDAEWEDSYENQGKYDKDKLKSLIETLEPLEYERIILGHGEPEDKYANLAYLKEEFSRL
jgi:glyoxylase-like metal-dependent hydrolase (beta-lactamase superfamily II)